VMFLFSFLVSLVQNATESGQPVTGDIAVPTTQVPNPVTAATIDIKSSNSREFVTVSRMSALDSATSVVEDERSANNRVFSLAASKTEPWSSYVVLITTISCFSFNLLSLE